MLFRHCAPVTNQPSQVIGCIKMYQNNRSPIKGWNSVQAVTATYQGRTIYTRISAITGTFLIVSRSVGGFRDDVELSFAYFGG